MSHMLQGTVAESEPVMESSLPSLPWQKIMIDLFDWQNSAYLIIVNYYSRFIEVANLHRTTPHEVIEQIKVIFARHGVPEEVMTSVCLISVSKLQQRLWV